MLEEAGIKASTDRLYISDRVAPMRSTADDRSLEIRQYRAEAKPTLNYHIVGGRAVTAGPGETHDDRDSVSRIRDERISEVKQLLAMASSDDWEGEGSLALSESTVDTAAAFLRACPEEAFLGEIDYAADATGDGDVMLTWAVGYDHLLTVLITRDCQVLHSAVSPNSVRERKGVTEWVETDQLPEGIVPCFDRLTAATS